MPSSASDRATSSVSSGRGTPTSWRAAPAGLVSGPSRLNAVRTPSSRRVGAGVPHRRMKRRREEERDAGLVEAALDDRRRGRDVDAERLEQVGAAAAARHRSVAVLRDRDAARGEHQRRDRRDVERVRAIAAGAAGVEHRRVVARQPRRPRAHRPREADDLGRPLPLHRQRDEQPGDLRRLRPAVHDLVHRRRRLPRPSGPARRCSFSSSGANIIDSAPGSCAAAVWPSPVSTDSGWNCTPWIGYSRGARP